MLKPKLRPIKVKEPIKQLQGEEQNTFVVMYNNELLIEWKDNMGGEIVNMQVDKRTGRVW